MEHLTKQSCEDFAAALASKTSVPGGGGAAALVGALSVALCSMVGNFTAGKKKYAAFEGDIQRILAESEALRLRLLALVDADAVAFEPLSRAYAIPRDDPSRPQIMEEATLAACQAPLEMVSCCAQVLKLLEELLEKGSRLLQSDVGCGAYLCKAALQSAALSVYVNTGTLQDRDTAARLEQQAEETLRTCLPLADHIAAAVAAQIRKEP